MKNKLGTIALIFIVIVLFIGANTLPIIIGDTINKNGLIDENKTTIKTGSRGYIQNEIDGASPGQSIVIPCGTYYENIEIYKPLTLIGNNCVTIDGNDNKNVVEITADDVIFSGFNVRNGTYGIFLDGDYENVLVSDCSCYDNDVGIWLLDCTGVHVDGCDFYDNREGFVIGRASYNNNVSNCNFWDNEDICVRLGTQTGRVNVFFKNSVTVTTKVGFYFDQFGAFSNRLEDNTVNECPIYLVSYVDNFTLEGKSSVLSSVVKATNYGLIIVYECDNVTVSNCTVANNNPYGIFIAGNNKNVKISDCSCYENNIGIWLHDSTGVDFHACDLYNNSEGLNIFTDNNHVSDCNIWYNSLVGIRLYGNDNVITSNFIFENLKGIGSQYDDNIIYNNFFNNTDNVGDSGINTWNILKTSGLNIMGGPYLGGNYWSDYEGEDDDNDGLGNTDLPYDNSGKIMNGGDWLPLIDWNTHPPDSPLIEGEIKGKMGEMYNYVFVTEDPDGDHVKYFIDWGDGDTEWTNYYDSEEEIILNHSWSTKGNYKIQAKAKDVRGAESSWATLDVKMPKTKLFIFNCPLLNWLLERFPNLFPIFRSLVRL